jgi:hypothetical protein
MSTVERFSVPGTFSSPGAPAAAVEQRFAAESDLNEE